MSMSVQGSSSRKCAHTIGNVSSLRRSTKENIKHRKRKTRLDNCTHELNSIRETSYSSRCIIPQRIFSTYNSRLNKIYAEIKFYVVWKYMNRMFRVMYAGESPSIYHHSHFIQAIRLCSAGKHYRDRFSKRSSCTDTPNHSLPAIHNVLPSNASSVSPTCKVSMGTGLKTKPDVCVTLVSVASK